MSGINSARPAGECIPINGAGSRVVVWADGRGLTIHQPAGCPARDLPALVAALERAAAALGVELPGRASVPDAYHRAFGRGG